MARSRLLYPDPQPLAFGRRTSVGNGLLTQFLEADMGKLAGCYTPDTGGHRRVDLAKAQQMGVSFLIRKRRSCCSPWRSSRCSA